MMRSLAKVFGLLAMAAPVSAQKLGTEAPDIAWERTFVFGDVPNQKLSDLKGSVIVLEFWTTYSNQCAQMVPKLNALFAAKAEAGLVVIGLTGDDANLVLPWVKKHDVKYPTASAQSKDYTVSGIPEAIVIDKDFKIAWRGHPAALEDATLDPLLVGAQPAVVVAGLEDVQTLRRASDHGGAWQKGKKLLEEGLLSERAKRQLTGWLTAYENFVTTAVAAADAAEKAGDVYEQWRNLEPLAGGYRGVPGTDAAKDRLDKLLAEPKHKREIDAGRKLAEARQKAAAFDFDGAHEAFKAVANAYANTRAGKAAAVAFKEIESQGKLGYLATCPYCKTSGAACPTHSKNKKKK
ncbi:MAG: TlpA family protein disulfide reductase [Planctomycetes bacterium]|nr:TlpA family protein disulfide reductase [Planctomycetota bacterium]